MKKIQKVASFDNKKLITGALYIANAVEKTFGPGGANFVIEKGNRVTNDGLTIAKELLGSQDDEVEDRGARIFVEALVQANEIAGDGSTTTAILSKAILNAAQRSKLPPAKLLKKVQEEVAVITDKLTASARPIETAEEAIAVATVSMEDASIGEMLGTAAYSLGKDGYIIAEDTTESQSRIEHVPGLYFDNGFGTSFVINNPEREALELRDVKMLYTSNVIHSLAPLAQALDALVVKGNRDIVIMARGFSNEAIQECLAQQQNGIRIYPLNAPYTDQSQVMTDLQAVIGGVFVNSEYAALDTIRAEDAGHVTYLLAKRFSTIISGNGAGVKDRIELLRKGLQSSGSEFEKKMVTSRIAQLESGFAILKVGASSNEQRKYLKDKADDAVNAVRAAMQEGTVKGSGVALFEIADELPDDFILKEAIKAPHERLVHNMDGTWVYDENIRDAVKIIRVALEKAASVASVLATAGGAVTTKFPQEKGIE